MVHQPVGAVLCVMFVLVMKGLETCHDRRAGVQLVSLFGAA
jgi:hypothetical protein